jgi:hypothetical protein
MNEDTVKSVADATKALSETGGKAIEAATSFGRVIKAPIEDLVGIVQDRVKFARWERQLALADKAAAIMKSRGLTHPTRDLPLNFAVPLLTHAVLEEDDELQEIWARLLVNAGDAATNMELRTAYVEILGGMSSFDVKNLSLIAKASLEATTVISPVMETWDLPNSTKLFDPRGSRKIGSISRELGTSLANLSRLGCAMPGGGFDAAVVFQLMTVTDLGKSLYLACKAE